MTITAAVAQYAPGADKDANLQTISEMVERAARRQAQLIVLPEYAIFTVDAMDERFVQAAEALDGPSSQRLAALSREYDMTIIGGINEVCESDPERIYNTLVAYQSGEIAETYRKIHLYDAFGYRESDRVIAGDASSELAVVEVGGFVVGMQTCYDIRFPEVSRTLIDRGAEILALPAEWVPGPGKEYFWNTLIRARAIENTAYVLAADQSGPTGVGQSAIIDPLGTTVAAMANEQGLATGCISRERLDQVRQINPALDLRRYSVRPAG